MNSQEQQYPPEVYSLTREYTVTYTDIDFNGNLKFSQLLNIFQNISIAHGNMLGIFIFPLKALDLAFVITNWRIVFHKPVKVEQKVNITTWIRKHKGSWLFRNYKVVDENGEILIDAAAQFLFMDLITKKPAEFIEGIINPVDRTIDSILLKEKFRIPKPRKENLYSEGKFVTGKSEIDFSMHINNSVYTDWAINQVPMEIYENKFLADTRISYRKECKYDEEISVKTYINETDEGTEIISVFSKFNGEKQVMVAQINTLWIDGESYTCLPTDEEDE
ncbi:MAG: hypothetical protein IJF98_06050 [Firmicutes bacterium]|nr:hypothetical protein [Bacillota bacterium]